MERRRSLVLRVGAPAGAAREDGATRRGSGASPSPVAEAGTGGAISGASRGGWSVASAVGAAVRGTGPERGVASPRDTGVDGRHHPATDASTPCSSATSDVSGRGCIAGQAPAADPRGGTPQHRARTAAAVERPPGLPRSTDQPDRACWATITGSARRASTTAHPAPSLTRGPRSPARAPRPLPMRRAQMSRVVPGRTRDRAGVTTTGAPERPPLRPRAVDLGRVTPPAAAGGGASTRTDASNASDAGLRSHDVGAVSQRTSRGAPSAAGDTSAARGGQRAAAVSYGLCGGVRTAALPSTLAPRHATLAGPARVRWRNGPAAQVSRRRISTSEGAR